MGTMPDTPSETRGPSRRTVARGAAWSTPAVIVAGAAPAAAASPPVVFTHRSSWHWYSNNFPYCSRGDGLTLSTTSNATGASFTSTKTTTSITEVSATFYFARNDITWTAITGDSGCWTTPTATGATSGGLYAYLTTYTCPITPVNGTTTLQGYAWRTQCYNLADSTWAQAKSTRRVARATVNGTVQQTDTGVFIVQS